MDPKQMKERVLEAARTKLNEHLAEYNERIAELRAVTVENELAETASQTEGRRDADIELMNSIGEQLAQVKRELDGLDQVDLTDAPHDTVRYGSVVVTDRHHLLIATSIDGFDVEGEEYLGLSTKAPLYQALNGKKAGETVQVNGNTFTIKQVY
ncbi:MAG: hypothetical protein R2810_11340 [Flavobacteriales bacterium]